jgi:hypothetical protein
MFPIRRAAVTQALGRMRMGSSHLLCVRYRCLCDLSAADAAVAWKQDSADLDKVIEEWG